MTLKNIIIDTDPGIDDAVAILLALASPELQVLGITTVAGNVSAPATATNACKIRELARRPEVPVLQGAAGPLIRQQIYGKYTEHDGLGADVLPAPQQGPDAEHSVSFLLRQSREARRRNEKITLCCMGPLTNIALAIAQDGEWAAGIDEVVMMGGAFGAMGNRVPWAEFNVLADPHAAHILFKSGLHIRLLPLDLTFKVLVTEQRLQRIAALPGDVAAKVVQLLTAYDRNDPKRLGCLGGPLHDPVVIAAVLAPQLFEQQHVAVGVEIHSPTTLGHTYADFYGKLDSTPNIHVQTDIDVDAFFDLLIERLGRYAQQGD